MELYTYKENMTFVSCVVLNTVYKLQYKTRSSAMAEGQRYALVSIEKSLQSMNDLDIHTRSSEFIRIAAIKWPYSMSLPVCGMLFQHLYLDIFKTLPLLK